MSLEVEKISECLRVVQTLTMPVIRSDAVNCMFSRGNRLRVVWHEWMGLWTLTNREKKRIMINNYSIKALVFLHRYRHMLVYKIFFKKITKTLRKYQNGCALFIIKFDYHCANGVDLSRLGILEKCRLNFASYLRLSKLFERFYCCDIFVNNACSARCSEVNHC